MNDAKRKRGLGRGLAALLGDAPSAEPAATQGGIAVESGGGGARPLPIELLHPNLTQPRQHYDEEALEALTQSIAEQGVLQPLIVRPHPERSGEYQIVAGERRWRAAQRAQLTELPVVVRALDDRQMLELAIVENVQREDLTALEEAEAYQRLTAEFGYSHDQIAKAVGKSRSHIANIQRLLALPPPVKSLSTSMLVMTAASATTLPGLGGSRGTSVSPLRASLRRSRANGWCRCQGIGKRRRKSSQAMV